MMEWMDGVSVPVGLAGDGGVGEGGDAGEQRGWAFWEGGVLGSASSPPLIHPCRHPCLPLGIHSVGVAFCAPGRLPCQRRVLGVPLRQAMCSGHTGCGLGHTCLRHTHACVCTYGCTCVQALRRGCRGLACLAFEGALRLAAGGAGSSVLSGLSHLTELELHNTAGEVAGAGAAGRVFPLTLCSLNI